MAVHYDFIVVPYRGRDFRLSYFKRAGNSHTLLFLHGLGGSKTDFVPAAAFPELDNCTLVGIDVPGCGQSNYFDDFSLNLWDVAEIVHQATIALDLPEFAVVGQSFSGVTALLLIEKHPERVRQFINLEGNLTPEDCNIFSRAACSYGFEGREEEYFRHLRHRLTESRQATLQTFGEIFRANVWSPKAWHDYCKSIVDLSDHKALRDQFVQLPIPRMFLYGVENRHLSYLPLLRDSTVKVIEVPSSNHFIVYSNPIFLYKSIGEFLNGNVGRGRDDS